VIQGNHIVQFVDTADVEDSYEMRLMDEEIRELNEQYNVNMCDSCDEWFDKPEITYLNEIDEDEFFARYVDNVENI
jgi:formylmethanofuran dehydrogenase subunit E